MTTKDVREKVFQSSGRFIVWSETHFIMIGVQRDLNRSVSELLEGKDLLIGCGSPRSAPSLWMWRNSCLWQDRKWVYAPLLASPSSQNSSKKEGTPNPPTPPRISFRPPPPYSPLPLIMQLAVPAVLWVGPPLEDKAALCGHRQRTGIKTSLNPDFSGSLAKYMYLEETHWSHVWPKSRWHTLQRLCVEA